MNAPAPMNAAFYDSLAPFYHLLYPDWKRAVREQSEALSSLLYDLGICVGDPVHDAACGIGTQTIGLASLGHNVTASDISPAAVRRLKTEIQALGLQVRSQVEDMRDLNGVPNGTLAAILACDNSIPHLLTDAEITQAFKVWWRRLRPGGAAVVSVRDYAKIPRISPDVRPYGLRDYNGCRSLIVQVWEWDGEYYDLSIYLTTESPDGKCETRVLRSKYYAVSIEGLCGLFANAGFVNVQRRDDVLFQPVLIAQKPNAG
jgi:SAM-dependent methyltransferase